MIFWKYFSLKITIIYLFLITAPVLISSRIDEADSEPVSYTILQEFKMVLMYFMEPFLNEAKIGNVSLEGESSIVATEIFSAAIKEFFKDGSNEHLVDFKSFSQKLGAGIKIKKILESNFSLKIGNNMAKSIQDSIKEEIKLNNGIIIPATWIGHSFALFIKLHENQVADKPDSYDLTVINSGQGLEHHDWRPDPNGIYPHLFKLWIEFQNIETDLIFEPETAWFIQALCFINVNSFVKNVNEAMHDFSSSASNYFYESLLANFRDYLVHPKEDEVVEKMVPKQMSGSCAISSLMAALLYHSESLKTYYWYRLKLGHVIMDVFLKKLQQPDLDIKLKDILTDGFDSSGIQYFKGLGRALISQLLQYLEQELPEEFKNSILIGSGRSAWILEKKEAAIEKLSQKPEILNDIILTISLVKRLCESISSFKLRIETISIPEQSKFKSNNDGRSLKADKINHRQPNFGEVTFAYDIFKDSSERVEPDGKAPFHNFEDFLSCFKKLLARKDNSKKVYFIRFLDIFDRLHAGSSWSLIKNHRKKKDLLEAQVLCESLAFNYVNISTKKPNLDEITLLGHLQLLSWNLFTTLHEIIFDKSFQWDEIVPPQSIQSLLLEYQGREGYISGNLRNWPIKGFNDMKNYPLFQRFIKDGQSEIFQKNGENGFPGPEIFGNQNFISFTKELSDKLMRNDFLRSEIFDCFFNAPEFISILEKFQQGGHKTFNIDWSKLDLNLAKLTIIFCICPSELIQIFPHFYRLMSTLRALIVGIVLPQNSQNAEKLSFVTYSESDNKFNFTLLCKYDATTLSPIKHYTYPIDFIESEDTFYLFRHSYSCPTLSGLTDLDPWMNYIKEPEVVKYLIAHIFSI